MKNFSLLLPIWLVLNGLIGTQTAFGQAQASVWYFGNKAGLRFDGDKLPYQLDDAVMSTREGCATICNDVGQLLFYTNGEKVWNRDHVIMDKGKGLHGYESTTQSSIIVPRPLSTDEYYIFTVGNDASPDDHGLSYSIVDMRLDGGHGDLTTKNIHVTQGTTEKITAVKHANGVNCWIIVHKLFDSIGTKHRFESYLLTPGGLDTVPVKSPMSGSPGIGLNSPIGYMKASPDGTRIACAHYKKDVLEVLRFNNFTGQLGYQRILDYEKGLGQYYGVEFSPSGRFLYASQRGPNGKIVQYDLLKDTFFVIANLSYPGAMQLAPDGKIYIVQLNSEYLSVIHRPDEQENCQLIQNDLDLIHGTGFSGLPNYVSSFLAKPGLSVWRLCLGDTSKMVISNARFDSAHWEIDGHFVKSANHNNPLSYLFKRSGRHRIKVTLYYMGSTEVLEEQVFVGLALASFLGDDIYTCEGETAVINPGFGKDSARIFWYGTYERDWYWTKGRQTVWAKMELGGCTYYDTLEAFEVKFDKLSIDTKTELCEGDTLHMNFHDSLSIVWFDSTVSNQRSFDKTGSYSFIMKNHHCEQQYDFSIQVEQNPYSFDIKDTSLCADDLLETSLAGLHGTPTWHDGSNDFDRTFSEAGNYWVTLDNGLCTFTDSFRLSQFDCTPKLELPNVVTINNDGLNETFQPMVVENVAELHTNIYNRWGNLVYESMDLNIGWKANGLSPGTYFYLVSYTDIRGRAGTLQGTVTVLK